MKQQVYYFITVVVEPEKPVSLVVPTSLPLTHCVQSVRTCVSNYKYIAKQTFRHCVFWKSVKSMHQLHVPNTTILGHKLGSEVAYTGNSSVVA